MALIIVNNLSSPFAISCVSAGASRYDWYWRQLPGTNRQPTWTFLSLWNSLDPVGRCTPLGSEVCSVNRQLAKLQSTFPLTQSVRGDVIRSSYIASGQTDQTCQQSPKSNDTRKNIPHRKRHQWWGGGETRGPFVQFFICLPAESQNANPGFSRPHRRQRQTGHGRLFLVYVSPPALPPPRIRTVPRYTCRDIIYARLKSCLPGTLKEG